MVQEDIAAKVAESLSPKVIAVDPEKRAPD